MCDIWLAIDYLNSNAAVLNMLIISFDRYFSVTRPLTYRAKRTTKHAILMISCAWILSLTIWTPAIFTYPYFKSRTVQGTDKCEIEFVKDNTYLTFVTAILAFYIPVIIMIYLYWRIWLETKKRYRDLTTLFLVSGVGAAASARPARPPPHSTSGQPLAPITSSTVPAIVATPGQTNQVCSARQQQPQASSCSAYQQRNGSQYPASLNRKSPPVPSQTDNLTITNKSRETLTRQSSPQEVASSFRLDSSKLSLEQVDAGALLKSDSTTQMAKQSKHQLLPVKCRCPACPRIIKGTSKMAKSSPQNQQMLQFGQNACCNLSSKLSSSLSCSKCNQSESLQLKKNNSHQTCLLCQPIIYQLNSESVNRNNCNLKRTCSGSKRHNQRTSKGTKTSASSNVSIKKEAQFENKCVLEDCNGEKVAPTGEFEDKNSTIDRESPSQLANNQRKHHNHHQHHHHHHHHHHHNHHQHHLSTSRSSPRKHSPHNSHHHSHHHHHHKHYHHKQHSNKHHSNHCHPNRLIDDHCIDSIDKQTTKLSLITSSYQLLSNNTKSLTGCSSILRKVHPTQQSNDKNTSTVNESSKQDNTETNAINEGLQSSLVNGDSTQKTLNEPSNDKNKQQETKVEMKDTGNSPIIFPSSPISLVDDDQEGEEEQDDDDDDDDDDEDFSDRDLETRIVSFGNKFRFEKPQEDGISFPKKINNKSAYKNRVSSINCRHCQQLTNQPACCSQALTIHDADCKMCNPNRARHHADSSNFNPKSDCQLCLRASQKHAARIIESSIATIRTTSDNLDQKRLPILSSLKENQNISKTPEITLQRQGSSTTGLSSDKEKEINSNMRGQQNGCRSKKKSKKFSQKLTFSDILVNEQRNQVEQSTKSRDTSRLNVQFNSSNYPIDDEDNQAANSQHQQQNSFLPGSGRLVAYLNWLKRLVCGEPRRTRSSSSYPVQQVDNRTMLRALCCGSAIKINTNAPAGSSKKRLSSNGSISNNKNSSSEDTSEPAASSSNLKTVQASSNKTAYSSHHPIQPKSERKAAKTLSTLLLVFIVTWLPYNILVLIKTLSGGGDQVPEKVWNFSYYLCYINSTINPLCYALCNAQFRRTYMRILKCKLSTEHNSTRRLVPLQSSTTWNKDLRTVTVSETTSNPTTTQGSLTTTNNNGQR